MTDRLIPLADAPAPASEPPESAPAPRLHQLTACSRPIPSTRLKLQPALVEAVSKVFDPEIPVNIYELGLIYNLDVDSNITCRCA